jgi:cell wall assembly regulator SMI1
VTGDRDLSGGAPDDGVATDWPRWLDVLERAGIPASSNLRAPAEPGAVADAEAVFGREFPPALRALYALADGQLADHPRAPGPHPEVGTSLFPATYRFVPLAEATREYRGWLDVVADMGHDHVTVRAGDPVLAHYWDAGWWPLAVDGGGNALVVDTVPEPGGAVGQIVVAGPDEDERRVVGTGVGDYLRRLIAAGPEVDDAVVDPSDRSYRFWDATHLR